MANSQAYFLVFLGAKVGKSNETGLFMEAYIVIDKRQDLDRGLVK
jgi:hypothetical protein